MSQELRDKIANFDDFFRPLRNYFYWEPHCFDTPICWALRSLFDALDGINQLTDQLDNVSAASPSLDELQTRPTQTSAEAAAIVLDPLGWTTTRSTFRNSLFIL